MSKEAKRIDHKAIEEAIEKIAREVAQKHTPSDRFLIVGIANGGIASAQKVATALGRIWGETPPVGLVNITFHRDDIAVNPIPSLKSNTDLPLSVDGLTILMVDDVVYSGRSARAALNEIFDLGRPESVALAALCDRGHRKLPIQPDFTGMHLTTRAEQKVLVQLDLDNPSSDSIILLNP